jgi:hypothetical protein
VIGFIDGVADAEIFGWALDRSSPGEPVLLTCRTGQRSIKFLTVDYRPDVALAFGTQGMNGFRLRIPPDLLQTNEVFVSIMSQAGSHLTNSPLRVGRHFLITRPPRSLEDQKDCLCFMHIQKTAGTAFREAIAQQYSASERLYVYPTPPGIWHHHFERIPPAQKKGVRYVAGHFVFGIHAELGIPSRYVTVIRDPVTRIVSHYHHLVRSQSEQIRSHGLVRSLEDILETQDVAELDNLMVRCFSGNGARQCPAGMVGRDAYELAIHNLKHFCFIGHQEKSEQAWIGLQQMFGWQSGPLRRLNVANTTTLSVSERTRRAIERYCKFDVMLYGKILSGASKR